MYFWETFMKKIFMFFFLIISLLARPAQAAFELETQKVTDNVYALVGEIGPRTAHNHALNNTLGFVVTDRAVVLIGSGATPKAAELVEKAIMQVTDKPVKWVINIGVQDHHWMGNSYFADKGVEIIALARTVKGQQANVDDELQRLTREIHDEVTTIKPVYAPHPINADTIVLNLGGIEMQLNWSGGGHFMQDATLWLPKQKVIFTGDVVFHERMLGIQPHTPVLQLQKAFHAIEALKPDHIIPGHGHAGNLAQARRDTGDYIDFLVNNVKKSLVDWKDIGETVNSLEDAPAFKHLKFYDGWHRRNINHTYLYLEAAQ